MGLGSEVQETYDRMSKYCNFVITRPTVKDFYEKHDPKNLWNIPIVIGFFKYALSHPGIFVKTIYLENKIYKVNQNEKYLN